MTTTTFNSVRGTPAPTEAPATKPAKGKGKAVPAAAAKAAKKPTITKPARKPDTIIIAGEGTLPIHIDGAMRRLPKGTSVKVSDAERAYLRRANIKFAC